MDFDEAETDMIRRGDMLGSKLGAKVATALETLQRERDEAVRIAKDTAVALTGLTPGGSEYCSYSRMLDTYFADVEACVGAVRRRYEDGHSARLALVEMRKERDAWRKAAVEAVIPLEALNAAGQGHLPDASWGEIRNGILVVRSTIEQFPATLTQGG